MILPTRRRGEDDWRPVAIYRYREECDLQEENG
mgnify:CR=1 FL=1